MNKTFTASLLAVISAVTASPPPLPVPDVDDGVRGLAFVDSVIKSSKSSQKWTKVKV